MKKVYFIITIFFLACNLFAADNWDIINKSMAAWNQNGSSDLEKAWTSYIGNNLKKKPDGYSLTQQDGFVNLTKTHTEATQNGAMVNTSVLPVLPNTAYTFEYKARINPIDKDLFPDDGNGWELNLLSARLNNYAPNLYLGYDADGNGYVTLEATFPSTIENRVAVNISEWNIYRFVMQPDATKFDLYINDELIFEAATSTAMPGTNILRLGSAAERARCNIDLEYAKMGTGDFNKRPVISSVSLSSESHITGTEATITVTANTAHIADNEKLHISLIGENEEEVVSPVDINVTENSATSELIIPANIPAGQYAVKVAALNGKIGDKDVEPKTIPYLIEAEEPPFSPWDILDKSMAAWNQNGGTPNNQAWAVNQGGSAAGIATQETGYVNFTKTNAGSTARWAWVKPTTAFSDLISGTAYSIEIKARVNPIGIPDEGNYFEANQIALRLGGEKITAPIYLKYGDGVTGGYVSTTSGGTDNVYTINTSVWQVYRLVLHADHSKYDVYVEGVEDPVIENILVGVKEDANGIYIGAESYHRCNIDIEYVKMGKGDFFSSPRISSIELSSGSHVTGTETTVSVTANTISISDGEKLKISLVGENDNEVVSPSEINVTGNSAVGDIIIPANVPAGQYAVKVAALNGKIGDKEVEPKTIQYVIEAEEPPFTPWDILDKSMATWDQNGGSDTNKAWTKYVGTNIGTDGYSINQGEGFVSLTKTAVGGLSHSVLINSPNLAVQQNTPYTIEFKARINPIDKTIYPDNEEGYESNLISARINKKVMDLFLRYADEGNEKGKGYAYLKATIDPYEDELYYLDVSEWHLYRFVLSADCTMYDVYIDGKLVFEGISTIGMDSNTNILRFGANIRNRCNIDVEYARMGTGDFNSQSRISTISISSDSHIEGNERTISVKAYTVLIEDGEKLQVSLTDENDTEIIAPIEFSVTNNIAQTDFTIPSSVLKGKYMINVTAPGGKIGEVEIEKKSFGYVVTDISPLETKMFPQVEPVGFVIDMDDYQYKNTSNEFIFPSIVDTKKFTVDGKFLNGQEPLARYYLFYTPHENPGGMYLATAPTLDGPWTERNMVMDLDWAKAVQGSNINTATHISACQVIWNEGISKYVMYFHGPNTTTHYATSDNLRDWTFGASILTATQFSAGGKETSYAKAFEHEIPGLNNKYIMMAMVQENSIRRIYWAHSADGRSWTPVRKPLISPDLEYKKVPGTDRKPSYSGAFGNNVAAPALFVKDGRYFVFCHGSAGNMCVVEVGESFDMEIHWGEYMKAEDVLIDTDNNGSPVAVPRIASPDFIQDDAGKWYMFFEAGSRLGSNIAYAKEPGAGTAINEMTIADWVSVSPNVVNTGATLLVKTHSENASLSELTLYNLTGNIISQKSVSDYQFTLYAPEVSGMYILNIRLDNNTTKEFKIIVK